jgi:hypothetical protein
MRKDTPSPASALVSIFIMGAFALLAGIRLKERTAEAAL